MQMNQSEYRYRKVAAEMIRRAILDVEEKDGHAADALRWIHGRGVRGAGNNRRMISFKRACDMAGVSPETIREHVRNQI
jgi:hypothetical protein